MPDTGMERSGVHSKVFKTSNRTIYYSDSKVFQQLSAHLSSSFSVQQISAANSSEQLFTSNKTFLSDKRSQRGSQVRLRSFKILNLSCVESNSCDDSFVLMNILRMDEISTSTYSQPSYIQDDK